MEQLQTSSPKTPLKTRIAPTPSGYLHLGNVLSFALTWAVARKQNGIVVLRIDDLDNTRFRPEYLHNIFDTLHFMGLDYDEGPASAEEFVQHYSQHLRLPLYNQFLERLTAQGLVYACPCSRSQILASSAIGNYPRTCLTKNLPLDTPNTAWRIRVPDNTEVSFYDQLLKRAYKLPLSEQMPDFVVRRKDKIPAYQVASVCDDLQMGINLVVRGQDLLNSTAAQVYLAQCVGDTTFPNMQFVHHPLLLEPTGNKLSKSHRSLSVHEMRKNGLKARDVWQWLAQALGWQNTAVTDAKSFLGRFELEDVPLQIRQEDWIREEE